ncbi:MAG: winged helix-turn-helix domain-containing protein [Pseudomonadota bacterium]
MSPLPAELSIGRLRVAPRTREVRLDGEVRRLSALSFDVLLTLVEAAPEPAGHDLLAQNAWRSDHVTDETIAQRIRILRRELDDDSRQPWLIETVRGRGYRLLPEIRSEGLSGLAAPGRKVTAGVAIVLAATVALALVLGLAGKGDVDAPPPTNVTGVGVPLADAHIDRGFDYLDRHRLEDNALARQQFEAALIAAPGNAAAIAGLSLSFSQSVSKFGAGAEAAARAEALARTAIEAAPELSLSHTALAAAFDAQGRIDDAIAAYEAALALRPDHAPLTANIAYLLAVQGQLARSLALHLEVADDLAVMPYGELQIAEVLRLLRFDGAAMQRLERVIELRPDNVFAPETMALAQLAAGTPAEAWRTIDAARERGIPRARLDLLAAVLTHAEGDVDATSALLAAAAARSPEGWGIDHFRVLLAPGGPAAEDCREREAVLVGAVEKGDVWPDNYRMLAEMRLSCGDADGAVQALEALLAAGYRDDRLLANWPPLAALRSDPAFAAVLAEMRSAAAAERAKVIDQGLVPESW